MRTRSLVFAVLAFAFAPPMPAWATAPDATRVVEAAPGLPSDLHDLDAYVESVRAAFEVPGIAIAIVKDGEVVLERGYGVRELGEPGAVDGGTLFAIASNTKAFTSAALSILADEGKLALDDRVIDHLPWFRMSDAYVTSEMRLQDLLTHRSGLGLGAGDLLFWPASDYTTRDIVERLRHVPLATGFRSRYAYDNILYAVAQLVIEKASGQSYGDFLQARILDPVGMAATRINSDALAGGDAVAIGHARLDFATPRPVPAMSWSNNAAAGGIYSNARDMARWMQVQLDGGVIDRGLATESRLFSAARQQAMWSVVTPIAVTRSPVPQLAAITPNFAGYGEGWNLSDYRGDKLVWHTGGWPGMVSRVTLLPARRLGVVVLTNQEEGAAFNAITLRVLDAYLGAGRTDWRAAYVAAKAVAQDKAGADWKAHQAARAVGSQPSLPLAGYAGRYRDPWYGDVEITPSGKGLQLRFTRTRQLLGTLEHWQHDSFIVRWHDRSLNADAFVSFALDADGRIREARMEAVSPLTDFSFDFHDLRLAPMADKP